MTGDGFSRQMAETAKQNLDRLKRLKIKKEIPKLQHDNDFNADSIKIKMTEDKLKIIRINAVKNQKKADFISSVKVLLISSIFLLLLGIYVVGILNKH